MKERGRYSWAGRRGKKGIVREVEGTRKVQLWREKGKGRYG